MRLDFRKLLKTHVEKMSAFRLSMMLMKTNELTFSPDVDEKKGTWLKPQVGNRDGGVRQRRLEFCSLGRFNDPAEGYAGVTRRCTAAGRGTDNIPHGRNTAKPWK